MTFDPLQQSSIPIYAFYNRLNKYTDLPNRYVPSDFLKIIFQNLELFYGFNKLYSQLPDIV